MKITLPRILALAAALIFLSFALIVSSSAYGQSSNTKNYQDEHSDSILIQKKIFGRSHKVSLYPDATQKVVFFTVRGEQGKVYQLYVFDLEGNLVKQTEIRSKQTTFISDIAKGVYVFDVFCDDDKIGNGQIAVR